jgi:hypothetical protein
MPSINFSNKTIPELRLNTVCPYFTMFPLDFPYNVLKSAAKTDLVFDPFCGRGTTNYAARLRGLNSFGMDSNPMAKAIAEVKLFSAKPGHILNAAERILRSAETDAIPGGEFWHLAYHPDTLNEICRFRNYFVQKVTLSNAEKALKALLLGVLHGPRTQTVPSYLSNQMPRTFASKPDYSVRFWRGRHLNPSYVNSIELIRRKSKYVFNEKSPAPVEGRIILGDSRRNLSDHIEERFNWVITSPPYYGMHSYEQDQWLRNWFLGGTEHVNYSANRQVKHHSEKSFISDLATVWKNTAEVCSPGARLIIRFGSLPSKSDKTPSEIIKDSIRLSECGWQISTIKNAGKPKDSHRQANQFKNSTGKYIEEIDVFATLKM